MGVELVVCRRCSVAARRGFRTVRRHGAADCERGRPADAIAMDISAFAMVQCARKKTRSGGFMPTKSDAKPKDEKPKETKAKAAAKPKPEGKVDGLHRPLQPSADLAAVVGDKPLARSEVVSKLWEHIKKNDLQDPKDRRTILADDKLERVFGKKQVTMFEMNKLISPHLK
jgi:upstream activation factor subunit UAF30